MNSDARVIVRERAAAVELPVPEGEDDDVRGPDVQRIQQQRPAIVRFAGEQRPHEEQERSAIGETDDNDKRDSKHEVELSIPCRCFPLLARVGVPCEYIGSKRQRGERDEEDDLEDGRQPSGAVSEIIDQ